jgi:transposase InsO family protein
VIAPASNLHWSSDGLEIPCWNGEVVRLAFAIDTHDREVMAWVATGGISGEMVRNLMLACVEQRFAALRAPHPVQWLVDSGSAYAAHDTRDFAVALNLVACFTPVRSSESNGISEAFVKTFKRDYARIHPGPMLPLSSSSSQPGSKTTTRFTPTKACKCAHPVSSSAPSLNQSRVRFDGGNSSQA